MRRQVLLVTALAVVAITTVAGTTVVAAGGSSAHGSNIESKPVPDWFLPIADAYDRSPAITPEFDFAGLYDARPTSYEPAAKRPFAYDSNPQRDGRRP